MRSLTLKLRDRSAADILRLVFAKFVYRATTMLVYEVTAADSVAPQGTRPADIDFWMSDSFARLSGTSPYLSTTDLERFRAANAVAIVALDGGEVVASSWMLNGRVWVSELWRTIEVPMGEHYSCRSYVSPALRGRHTLAHMLHAFAKEFAAPDDRLWGLVYSWNQASFRSLERIGWHQSGEVGTNWVLGYPIPTSRSENRPIQCNENL